MSTDYLKEMTSEYAEPFLFEGSDVGCLLIHGFTGTPGRVRLLGEYLHKEGGYTVSGIRLKGHGTSLDDMYHTDWHDWLRSARQGYEELEKRCSRVFVVGFSMGGVLSLLLAEELPVDRLVTINTPIKVRDKTVAFARILQYFKRYNTWDDESHFDPEVANYNVAYEGMPIKAIPSLLTLIKKAERNLDFIVRRTLIIQSQKDETVNPVSARIIYRKISSIRKEVFWLKKSSHVAPLGPERDRIHKKILHFLQEE